MQHWDEAADWTYSSYTEGSLVWAKIDGYPWWPAMVEIDPDLNAFVFCYDNRKYSPVSSHFAIFAFVYVNKRIGNDNQVHLT